MQIYPFTSKKQDQTNKKRLTFGPPSSVLRQNILKEIRTQSPSQDSQITASASEATKKKKEPF